MCTLTHVQFANACNTLATVDGMTTALLHPSPCLCFHVDRCMHDSNMQVTKCLTSLQLGDCFLPVFEPGTMDFNHYEYTVVATMSHLGTDGAGHYRAALRVHPMVVGHSNPIRWLITDDWRAPQAVWAPEPWLLETISMVWLVRSDLLKLHFYSGTPTSTGDSMQELFALLTTATT